MYLIPEVYKRGGQCPPLSQQKKEQRTENELSHRPNEILFVLHTDISLIMNSTELATRVIAGVTVPDTPLITGALDLARKYLEDPGYAHVVRSWLTVFLLISALPLAQRQLLDLEAISVATILHDLGWSESSDIRTLDRVFEVDGAEAARDFIRREGNPDEWDKHRTQLVWDAIALHTVSISEYKEPEVALSSAGINVDLFGPEASKQLFGVNMGNVTQNQLDAISNAYPKTGTRGYVRDVFVSFCRQKPNVTYWTMAAGWGDKYLDGYSSKGKLVVDVMEPLMPE